MRTAAQRAVRITCVLFLLIGVSAIAMDANAALPLEIHQCNDNINHSFRLGNALTCTGDGLNIIANGIVVDLGKFRIDGDNDAGDIGIDDSAGFNHVTVRNGTIANFGTGVEMDNTFNGVVRKVRIIHTTVGIHFDNSAIMTADRNIIVNQTGVGATISLDTVGNSDITRNQSIGGDGDAISLNAGGGVRIKKNVSSGFDFNGIFLSGSTQNTITGNRSIGDNVGIHLNVGADKNKLVKNTVLFARVDGIFLSSADENTLTKNNVSNNGFAGIDLTGSATNVLTKNKANDNGVHGIDSDNATVTMNKNTVNRNGFRNDPPGGDNFGLGINSSNGTLGSLNKAAGNDDPAQCAPLLPANFCV